MLEVWLGLKVGTLDKSMKKVFKSVVSSVKCDQML